MEAPATALLFDHDPTTADLLRAAIADEPFAFDVAYDLPTAIRCLDSGRYGGAIVDLASPQALEVLRHMSSHGMTLPTVVISARLPESVRAALARQDIKLVLPKPTETWMLLNVLRGLSEAGTPAPSLSLPRPPTSTLPCRSALPPARTAETARVPEELPRR
jgi:DNA-binding response OmpR family regulator